MLIAESSAIAIDGVGLVTGLIAAGGAIGTGIRYGLKAAAGIITAYLSRRDEEQKAAVKVAEEREDALREVLTQTATAVSELRTAVADQGRALNDLVREVASQRGHLDELRQKPRAGG